MISALGRAVGLVLVLALAYLAVTSAQVWTSSRGTWVSGQEPEEPPGAIVVLGAAQYDGRPSPVLQARLDHAIDLYRDGVAPVVVVTGSNQPGDRVTEASASAQYLHRNGIADDVIRREVLSRNTYDQIAATRTILRREGIDKVVLVSDPLHSHRLALTARETGLDAEVSPRTVRVASAGQRARTLLRETIAVSAGRVVGFRRLRNLQGELRAADAPPPPRLAAGTASGAG